MNLERQLPLVIEKVEILNGDRPRAAGQSAVRRDALADLARLEPTSAHSAGATPTAEELDKVVDDIAEIMRALRVVAGR